MPGTAAAKGTCLPILMKDGKLVEPPAYWTVKVTLESPEGTFTNTLVQVNAKWLKQAQHVMVNIGEILTASEWAIYHHGEPLENLNVIYLEAPHGDGRTR